MLNQVLVNVEATDIRVALLEDGNLVELFVDHFNQKSILGNIYKGKVEAIVPGLKAVFVNIGMEKNAFLHFADVLQEYELPDRGRPERLRPQAKPVDAEEWGEDGDDYIPPPILPDSELTEAENAELAKPRSTRALKVGDSILVQVIKEPLKEKGPRVTSYISVPGRFLVMMPYSDNHGGVSRKISDAEERRRLRDILKSLNADTGAFIIRTAGLKEEECAIREDYEALTRQWKSIIKKNFRMPAPALVYDDADILHKLVRDTLRNDVDEILIDSKKQMKALIHACETMAPGLVNRIALFESSRNIFDVFEVEKQFQKALRRKVWLKSGGAIVIDETEALTAIDVNSGKYVGDEDQESVILKTNLEACRAITRQLRLRDLGGLIVMDFIDMTNREHQAQVLRELRNYLKKDNAKYAMTGFSEFGLIEMTRKRVRMSLAHVMNRACPYCEGTGKILNEAQTWKLIKYALLEELRNNEPAESVDIVVNSQIRTYLEKEVFNDVKAIANKFKVRLHFVGKPDYHHEQFSIIKRVKSVVCSEPADCMAAPPSIERPPLPIPCAMDEDMAVVSLGETEEENAKMSQKETIEELTEVSERKSSRRRKRNEKPLDSSKTPQDNLPSQP